MKNKKLFTIYMTIIIVLFIISVPIALVILFRPFYYWQINALNIVDSSGYDLQTIKTAYNEMLDFCIGISKTFSTGALKFSEEGMLHFVDCKKLFILDFVVAAFSTINLIIYFYLHKTKNITLLRLANHSAACNASKGILTSAICIVLLVLPDFDAAFTMFHKIFFPGKDNWLFDPRYDQIINILPEEFFMNCAIAIASLITILCLYFIYVDYRNPKNRT